MCIRDSPCDAATAECKMGMADRPARSAHVDRTRPVQRDCHQQRAHKFMSSMRTTDRPAISC
eukprot:5489164-Alexandrium_andersonii.AAC.1